MRVAILSTIWFALIHLTGDPNGPWYAAIASIFMGDVCDRLLDRRAYGAAEYHARGVLGTALLAGYAVKYIPYLPGPEWLHIAISSAAIFVCAAVASSYIRAVREVDRIADDALSVIIRRKQ